jgi:hypothetical protein
VACVFEGHANARHRELELAYYTAWHSGLFSQSYKRFPDYEKHAPRRARQSPKPQTPEEMKAVARAITLALGGKVKKRGS